ncbi:glycoside hydrolase family 2, partial [Alistipes sp. OttesenSCG-928-L06]|nr:glycoside hydrolase family 2 [Alistipes sp. OttesenSCG-928-L06]
MTRLLSVLGALLLTATAWAYQPETSVAGFYPLEGSGRSVFNFNVGWHFHKGDAAGAEAVDFDDSSWTVVAAPHTPELVPAEASGGRTYQGVVWYRKHYTLDPALAGKRVTVYFEAVMGKKQVFVNGKPVLEHFGGYLPFSIELSELGVEPGKEFVLAVRADNSDDKTYPPGKPQNLLDFTYHGGIYRDVWMIATDPVHITDANKAGRVAGGGVFVHYDNISAARANVYVDTEVKNTDSRRRVVKVETVLRDGAGVEVGRRLSSVSLAAGESRQVKHPITVSNPKLWEPDAPHLYKVETRVLMGNRSLDGGITRVGIRKLEFRGTEGFFLNGRYFGQLIGTNRHQDFAYVGNASPNSQQWRDAKLIRDAGCRIIRSAHYPQDPAFMDACDELGIFIIVATPGWQFWNKDEVFVNRVYDDVRNMIRRDRNHPSVIWWEPVLNETPYPQDFMLGTRQATQEEYPYPGCFMVGDSKHGNRQTGVAEHYEVLYGWPADEGKFRQPIFTREFGEMVDDWYAHNTPNRAARYWGEGAQVAQALSLAKSYDAMYETTGQFIGGAQWHSFDHQRGYHPDTYYGGLWDVFRQPKYASYMFRSQIAPDVQHPFAQTGPMVFIAHEITPFSESDVVVFSNCDSVRLTVYEDENRVFTLPVVREKGHMPYQPVVFKDVYQFMDLRQLTYVRKTPEKVSFVAEGIIDGKVVCTEKKMPSRRADKLSLRVDHQGQALVADGSDFAVVVCEVTDMDGHVRRLAKDRILFTVEGEGRIIGDASIGANPREVEFGSAPVLVRSTTKPGKIKVTARVMFEGYNAPQSVSVEFDSVAPEYPLAYTYEPRAVGATDEVSGKSLDEKVSEEERQRQLKQVEQQQVEFGEKF